MAVKSYECDGETLWEAYVNLRSKKNPKLRLQRRVKGLRSLNAASSEEKRLIADLNKEVTRLESKGARWEEVIDRWQSHKLTYRLRDAVSESSETTINDYAQLLKNWTKHWFGRPAQDLNRADGREVLQFAREAGNSTNFVRKLKNVIQQVYEWGIEERFITDVHVSPVYGIDIAQEKEHKIPEVLNFQEAQLLVKTAEDLMHPWTCIWKGALLTGMRSGELLALPWCNVELVSKEEADRQETLPDVERRYGLIRVHRTWNGRLKKFGPTKGGYWRSVPISGELYRFLIELRKRTGSKECVFPKYSDWTRGLQAQVLRKFCVSTGIKSIKFHALRATFATLLISKGVAPARVMKICGWKDLKTMQYYIRLSGIDEQGATEALHLLIRGAEGNDADQSQVDSDEVNHEDEGLSSEDDEELEAGENIDASCSV
jgi:integrase